MVLSVLLTWRLVNQLTTRQLVPAVSQSGGDRDPHTEVFPQQRCAQPVAPKSGWVLAVPRSGPGAVSRAAGNWAPGPWLGLPVPLRLGKQEASPSAACGLGKLGSGSFTCAKQHLPP